MILNYRAQRYEINLKYTNNFVKNDISRRCLFNMNPESQTKTFGVHIILTYPHYFCFTSI